MKLIRAARVYRLNLPAASTLTNHLAECVHREIFETSFSNVGFVAPANQTGLVLPFEGGYAFAVRYDEKIVPAAVVSAEAQKRIALVETEQDTRLAKKHRQDIRDQVFSELCRKALVRPTVVTCFYREADRLLIVPTASRKMADIVTSLLVKVVGSIKATTIYVSSAKHGLTTRLARYLEDDDLAFDGFGVGGTCKLKLPESRSVTVKLGELYEGKDGLQESLVAGGCVTEIALSMSDVEFRLTDDFVIKGVEFTSEIEDDDFGGHVSTWRHEAAIRTLQFAAVVDGLCQMLDYKEPVAEADDLV